MKITIEFDENEISTLISAVKYALNSLELEKEKSELLRVDFDGDCGIGFINFILKKLDRAFIKAINSRDADDEAAPATQ